MKKSRIIITILSVIGLTAFGQDKTITGKIESVSPYNDEFRLTINDTAFVLIVQPNDASKKKFDVNKQYKDILVEKKGKYELNSKYAEKTMVFSYYINGKGWKCIKTIEPSKK